MPLFRAVAEVITGASIMSGVATAQVLQATAEGRVEGGEVQIVLLFPFVGRNATAR